MPDEFDAAKILDGNIDQVKTNLDGIDDPEQVQLVLETELTGQARAGVMAAAEKRAKALDAGADSGAVTEGSADVAVDMDGYWPQIMHGSPDAIRQVIDRVETMADLQLAWDTETAGRKRAGVFMNIEQRRMAIRPAKGRKGKVKPPVWLDSEGEVRHLKDVTVVATKMHPEERHVAVVYDAELPGHTGRYKALLSVLNGMPIGGTMGGYLARIYAKSEGD